jgi:hypothetical protein
MAAISTNAKSSPSSQLKPGFFCDQPQAAPLKNIYLPAQITKITRAHFDPANSPANIETPSGATGPNPLLDTKGGLIGEPHG